MFSRVLVNVKRGVLLVKSLFQTQPNKIQMVFKYVTAAVQMCGSLKKNEKKKRKHICNFVNSKIKCKKCVQCVEYCVCVVAAGST